MRDLRFTEPPTRHSLEEARRSLQEQQESSNRIASKIEDAEQELKRILKESQQMIWNLEKERAAVEDGIARTLAYLSPIRRLPHELLGVIFTFIFDDYPCCAWVLSAVCKLWRSQVLSMPRLWSKIRLVTTQSASPDTVRLWLERAGPTVPLDIEIFLHTQDPQNADGSSSRRRAPLRAHSPGVGWGATWSDWGHTPDPADEHDHGGIPYAHHAGTLHFVPVVIAQPNTPTPPPLGDPLEIQHHGVGNPLPAWKQICQNSRSRGSMHWGHIAFFYLTEQMHRWSRFVFRFDRQFSSISSLKSITGDAPLLREFEVSCAEPGLFNDWTWLPCTPSAYQLPLMDTLTLQYVPFKWSAPIFKGLRSLSIRAIPANSIALDRILHMIKQNPGLESLSLYFTSVNPPVLPLLPLTLEHLKYFSIGGHFLLSGLVDSLSLPSLETLIFDIDPRDTVEEMLSSLLARSQHPPMQKLSIAYNGNLTSPNGVFYGQGAMVTSWQFLAEMEDLHTLQVGGSALEPLVSLLGAPDDDNMDQWYCPNLISLALRNCRAHGDGVAKLVQMVESRNPDSGTTPITAGGVTPVKLKHLELYDCGLGQDVVRWMDGRIDSVSCYEPFEDRSPRSPGLHFIA
ncbi:hypothetical protein BDW22DRAFT_1359033 [Trametopsis cervina]|nr:hypothetical protein BDW22DRAFT_1359033 [Trametopsis cervina]